MGIPTSCLIRGVPCRTDPNAFLFGLTGTPINKADKNTFWAFGAEQDTGNYMSRYTFQDSIRDNATLPLHFEPRLPHYHIDKDSLDVALKEMVNDLSEQDQNKLSQKAAKMAVFLKSPERVKTIVKDIAEHFQKHVEPEGFKAMIVTPLRHGIGVKLPRLLVSLCVAQTFLMQILKKQLC